MDNKEIYMSTLVDNTETENKTTNEEQLLDNFTSYEMKELIDNIGKINFKNNYLLFKEDLNNKSIDFKREICRILLEKIRIYYGFEFSIKPDFPTEKSISDFFKFIEFIEYDHEFIIDKIVEQTNVEMNDEWINDNFENIIKIIENNYNHYYENDYIINFLMYISKEPTQTFIKHCFKIDEKGIKLKIKLKNLI